MHNESKRKYVLRAIAGIYDCGVYIAVPALAVPALAVPALAVPALELVSSVLFIIAKAYTLKQ